MAKNDEEYEKLHVTDIDALSDNTDRAVEEFAARWVPVPRLTLQCEVMDVRQLRDAMGLRSTFEAGDPWPQAEKKLLDLGFRWHWLGGCRVMLLQERDGFITDDGWSDGELIDED